MITCERCGEVEKRRGNTQKYCKSCGEQVAKERANQRRVGRPLTEDQQERRRTRDRAAYAANPERFREAKRREYANNKGKLYERLKAWRAAHPDRVRERNRAWAKAHPEAHAAAIKRWQQNNREKGHVAHRKWALKNQEHRREYARQWQRAHAEAGLERVRRRQLLKKGSAAQHTKADFLALCERVGWLCAYCSCPLTVGTAVREHKVPLVRGGSDAIENVAPSCRHCNQTKYTLTDEEFRAARLAGTK